MPNSWKTLLCLAAAAAGLLVLLPIASDTPPEALLLPSDESPAAKAVSGTVDAVSGNLALTERCLLAAAIADAGDGSWPSDQAIQMEQYIEAAQASKNRLTVSQSPEHLHAAAMLSEDPVERTHLMTRAVASSANEPFLVFSAVRFCAEAAAAAECPLRQWEERLLSLDRQNSESWMLVAANRWRAGERDAALLAVQQAAASSESRAWWVESIELLERAYAAGSNFPFAERASRALGSAVRNLPDWSDYLRMCRTESEQSDAWARACLGYGKQVEHQGKTELGLALARAIQISALEVLDDNRDQLTAVRERQAAARLSRAARPVASNARYEALLVATPRLFYRFLAFVREHGETEARRRMHVELEQDFALADCEPL